MTLLVRPVQGWTYQVLPRSLTARLPGSLALADPSMKREKRERWVFMERGERRLFMERRERRVFMARRERRLFMERRERRLFIVQCWAWTGSSVVEAQGPNY